MSSVDVIESHAQFSHEVVLLAQIFNRSIEELNPSGGPLVGNVMMAAGLDAIGHTFKKLQNHSAKTGLAHAASGPCLQQNLLAYLRCEL